MRSLVGLGPERLVIGRARDGSEVEVTVAADGSQLVDAAVSMPQPDVAEVTLGSATPATVSVSWTVPAIGATCLWSPEADAHGLPHHPVRRTAGVASGVPVGALVGSGDVSLCTYAAAEVIHPVTTCVSVVEEAAAFCFRVEQQVDGTNERLRVRIDLSARHLFRCLEDVGTWWAGGRRLPEVPRVARMPVYSTWYGLHQAVTAESVERQAELAAELGCEALILDDGWQTGDGSRGYRYCGDWDPDPTSFHDLESHIDRVHGHGLRYLLWYSLPFIGLDAAARREFEDSALGVLDHEGAIVVVPGTRPFAAT